MNVNSDSGSGKRTRRTPEQAKALILQVAAERLAAHGLAGLSIAGVAKAAGMSHATVIHHFGSTGAMREALLARMTDDLLADVVSALDHQEPADRLLERLFGMLSRDGHGRLLAWLALDHQEQQDSSVQVADNRTGELFNSIVQAIAARQGSESDARQEVFLVAAAAMGLAISGDVLAKLIGLSNQELEAFPGWLAAHIRAL